MIYKQGLLLNQVVINSLPVLSCLFPVCLQSFNTLHMMYHEATACHVTGDLVELLSIFLSVLKATHPYLHRKGIKSCFHDKFSAEELKTLPKCI